MEESYRQPIRKFSQLSQHRYEVEPFTKKDIEGFIRTYKAPAEIMASKEKISNLATNILYNTNGHPIMVKFYVIGKGLKEDVEDRYYRYLTDVTTTLPHLTKIQTVLICSLLDIANLSITDKLLEWKFKIMLMTLNMQCYTNILKAYGKQYTHGGIWSYYPFYIMRRIKVYS